MLRKSHDDVHVKHMASRGVLLLWQNIMFDHEYCVEKADHPVTLNFNKVIFVLEVRLQTLAHAACRGALSLQTQPPASRCFWIVLGLGCGCMHAHCL